MTPIVVVERFYSEIWNQGDLGAADQLCHPDMAFRGSLGQVKSGVAEFLEYVRYIRGGLNPYQCIILETVVQDDRVFAKMLFRGLHCGPLEGIKSTGAEVEWQGAALFKIERGRIRDLWVCGDVHGLHRQLQKAQDA
ncbi:MAG: ester cyclase [Candidatus Binatia bacterium]